MIRNRLFSFVVLLLVSLVPLGTAQDTTIQHPREIIGQELGENNKVPNWNKIVEYFRYLDGVSDRVHFEQLGDSSRGLPFVMATISSPENLANLEEYRQIMNRLADPRGLSESEAESLIARGKNVVAITCAVDADEVGSPQSAMLFAYTLATEDTPEVREILDNTILLLVPSLNPDGYNVYSEWVAKTAGTPYEGTMADSHHFYYGENNRDWFNFVHPETRLTVEHVFNAWRPPIIFDMHQMGGRLSRGVRMWVPPFVEPNEPNVHPLILQSTNELGMFLATSLIELGKPGVSFHSIYDAFNPMRQYGPLHNSVRMLSEAATPNLATDVTLRPDQLAPQRNVDVTKFSWNNPIPWKGGEWGIRQVIEYEQPIMMAAMTHASRYRERWLRNHLTIYRDSVEYQGKPFAFIIPSEQRDTSTAAELIDKLIFADVEVHRSDAAFTADGVAYEAGDYILPIAQPYGRYLKAVMETKGYPMVYNGDDAIAPYDSIGFTLPVQMGVASVQVELPFEVQMTKLDAAPAPAGSFTGSADSTGYIIARSSNAAIKAVTGLMEDSNEVFWLREDVEVEGAIHPDGSFYIPASPGLETRLRSMSTGLGVDITGVVESIDVPMQQLKHARIGVYRSYARERYDEYGWYFKLFDEYGFPWKELVDGDIRGGSLRDDVDVIILPPYLRSEVILNGRQPGTIFPEQLGGIGALGVRNLKAFVEAGGTLIANDMSTDLAIREFGLPVRNVVRDLTDAEFVVPGSLVRLIGNGDSPVNFGMSRDFAAMNFLNPVFEITGEGAEAVARYPAMNPLISGWLTGEENLFDRAAVVDAQVGDGHVFLFGIRPIYRMQARGTYKLLFNSILYGSAAPVDRPERPQ